MTRATVETTGTSYCGTPVIRQTPGNFGIEIEAIYGRSSCRSFQDVAAVIRAAGVRCNAESYNHETRTAWKVVHDGSVSFGCEIVSPILNGEAGIEEARTVMNALVAAGMSVDKSCGFHVHLDATGWDVEDFRRVLKVWCANERAIDMLVAKSRRGSANVYCKSTLARIGGMSGMSGMYDANALVNGADPIPYVQRAYDRLDEARTIREIMMLQGGDRYYKLNLDAFNRHGTIEFRNHQGTVNAAKMELWVRLLSGMVAKARSSRCIRRPTNVRTRMASAIFRLNRMSGGSQETYDALYGRAKDLAKEEGRRMRAPVVRRARVASAPVEQALANAAAVGVVEAAYDHPF